MVLEPLRQHEREHKVEGGSLFCEAGTSVVLVSLPRAQVEVGIQRPSTLQHGQGRCSVSQFGDCGASGSSLLCCSVCGFLESSQLDFAATLIIKHRKKDGGCT